MANSDYRPSGGTVTLTAAETEFTTSGALLQTRGFGLGDGIYASGAGKWLIVDTITGENSGTLLFPCPADCAVEDGPLFMRYQPDAARQAAQTRELLDQLSQGLLLTPDKKGAIASRDQWDGQPEGFAFMSVDEEGGFKIYVKKSDADADWSDGQTYEGVEGAPGAQGPAGEGFNLAGEWDSEAAYDENDLVWHGSRSFASLVDSNTGNEPPDADEDDGYWQFVPSAVGPKGDQGDPGDTGSPGSDGSDGDDGWTPVLAVVADDARYVQQVVDWTGGEGTKPATGKYVGATGLVDDIEDGINIRGASGSGSGDVVGPASAADANIALFDGATGKAIKDGGAKLFDYTKTSDLAAVATTGAYSDLSGTPTLGTVATSNDYGDLDNLPPLGTASAAALIDADDFSGATASNVNSAEATKAYADAIQTLLSSAANINFLQGGTGAVSRTVANKFGEIVSCKDFDVKGDGSTDDATNLQKAVDYLESLGGGVLRVPAGVYMLSSEILIQQAILLLCDGYGEDGSNASGDDTRLVTFRRTVAGDAAPIFRFQSATDTQKIRGGGILGAMLDGNDVATIGVHARSCDYQKFDLATWSLVNSAIRIDDGNNATPSFNEIWLQFIWGTGTISAGAHALHFRGEDGTGGCTRNIIWRLNGLHKDGHMMFLDGNVDNNQAMEFNATRSSGGTGYSVKMADGASSHPRSNRFYNFSGRIYESTNAYGNEFFSVTSEQSSYEVESGVGNSIFHSIVDYADGTPYRGPMMKMRDEIRISGGMFMPMINFGAIASVWGAILMDDSATETVYAVVGRDQELPAGHITGVRFAFLMASANTSKSVRLQVRIETATPGTSVTFADTNESFTVPVNDTAGVLNEQSVTLSSSLAIAKGDTILFRLDRLGGDALDTATGDLGILSATLLYEYSGPVNIAGGGTFAVPALP